MFILIEQGNYCNLHCKSCPTRLHVRPKGFMSLDTLKSIVEQEIAHKETFVRERIVLHGYGELFMNKDIWTNLDYLESKGFMNVDFSDNCMLLTEEIVKKLCNYKMFNYIKLSLNSTRKDLMERINTGSNFDKVVENIKMVCDTVKACGSPFKIQVQLMHTSKNMDETKQNVFDLIQRDNFDVTECKIMSMLNMDKDNELLIPSYEFWDGECVFSETSRMFHWDGDEVGCCVDNTKTQVICNERGGIYSEKSEARRAKMRQDLQDNICNNLPACAKCEGKRK